MATTITDMLNIMNDYGIFSYVIPFLLIFAVVHAILEKSEMLGKNKNIHAVIAASIGLLSLQFDLVPEFFGVIFPRFGIGLAIFLTLLILLGFFFHPFEFTSQMSWVGWVVGIGVVIWALSSWDQWSAFGGFGGWFAEYIWALIILGAVIAIIVIAGRDPEVAKKAREERAAWVKEQRKN
jgi:hypothetical protein